MAITTYKTFLMRKVGTTWSKLIDIKAFPSLGGSPEMLDKTTLSEGARTYLLGIQETEKLEFDANYDLADYNNLMELQYQELDLAVWFGATVSNGVATPTGEDGKFEFKGYISPTVNGGGVNEVIGLSISIAPTTVIKQTQDVVEHASVLLDRHAIQLSVNETFTFSPITVPEGKSITWASSNTAKAEVAAGVVTAKATGFAIITATITDGGVDYSDTCTVVVVA